MSMEEISDESIHLIITSPPYFDAPFDYKGLFKNYEQYLGVQKKNGERSLPCFTSRQNICFED